MVGNIGVHFEDVGYAVTDKATTLNNLLKAGYKKVAATSLGVFTQYEEVLDIIAHDKIDIDVIPGIQCYFEGADEVLTLIAKDYEGYLQLSKIITESNALGTVIEDANNNNKNKAIVYLDNLKRHVQGGHLYCTSSGKNGVFSNYLSTQKMVLQEQIDAVEEELSNIYTVNGRNMSYYNLATLYDNYAVWSSIKKPLKKEIEWAQKIFEETGDRSDLDYYEQQTKDYEDAKNNIARIEPYMSEIKKALTKHNKTYNRKIALEDALFEFNDTEERNKAINLYKELESLFGKENMLFELQCHNDKTESSLMKQIVSFAHEVQGDNPNFVLNNDVRIGVLNNDEQMEYELHRLNIAEFLNNKVGTTNEYIPFSETQKEAQYCIKTEEEMKKEISEMLSPLSDTYDIENIVNNAAKKTDEVMNSCFIDKHHNENHYPKFCDDENAEFEKKCLEGIPWRFPNGLSQEYQDRLNHELNIIKTMGYAGYHLIVQDYLRYARLLGYLDDNQLEDAPLTIDELEKYLDENRIERIGSGIGPGRGSAAGSLCCYLLGITDVDPIKNGLLFERFLNPERVSMPDIDSDFRPEVRYKAIDYVKKKYGANNICQIVTKMYNQEKGCIRDAARYVGALHAYNEKQRGASKEFITHKKQEYEKLGDLLTKDYDAYEKQMTNDGVLDTNLEHFFKTNEVTLPMESKEILTNALYIDQLFTGYGRHAAGVIISKDCVGDSMPLMLNPVTKMMQTQCQMAFAEAKGYLKMDFLGLRNLATITDTVKHPFKDEDKTDYCQDAVKREQHILSNKRVISEIFCKGLTQGVFQFESPGMKKLLIRFQPKTFDDIVLLNAAYRPGPMAYLDEMIAIKNWEEGGRKGPMPPRSISLKNDTLDSILVKTYGCPVYQEQIMQIFQQMAGYSLGRADEVRRAMSKKKVEVLEKERDIFIHGNAKEIEAANNKLNELKLKVNTLPEGSEKESVKYEIEHFNIPKEVPGCVKLQGVTEKEANDLFDQMMPFAKYGFNKSHAVAYSVVSMQTAWLKLYRTKDFYCSALNHWKNRDEVPKYVAEMYNFGIQLLPPTLDSTSFDFTVEEDGIRFPIVKAKDFDKSFKAIPEKSLQGFIRKNPNITESKLKTLIYLGCFDKCWNFKGKGAEKEIKRVGGSKAEQLSWLRKHYKTLKSINDIEHALKYDNLDEKATEKKTKQLNDKNQALMESAKADMDNATGVDSQGKKIIIPVKHTAEEIFNERAKEYELTGNIFSIAEDFKKINQYNNQNTYDELLSAPLDTRKPISIPCVILGISEEKRTKRNELFFDASLMDRNGTVFTRRFKDRPTQTCGIFNLYADNQKFFRSDTICVDDILTTQNNINKQNTQSHAKAIMDLMNDTIYSPKVPVAPDITSEENIREM